jgi:hypothetical protein
VLRTHVVTLASAVCAVAVLACGSDKVTDPLEMAWFEDLVQSIEEAPVTSPPTVIFEYRYRRQAVYFVPARCCDVPSDLYDRDGQVLCHPDGGFTGKGDRRCPDFYAARTDERVVWRDPRPPSSSRGRR